MWSTLGFLLKLCEVLKTIVATLLAQLVTPIHPKNFFESKTIAHQANVSPCKNLMLAIHEHVGNLIPSFTNVIVIDQIFPCLPLNPSNCWCFYRMNKTWYRIVRQTIIWNGHEIVQNNHASHLESITKMGTHK